MIRNRRTRIAAIVASVIVIGLLGYTLAGFAVAATRIASADRILNTVVSHQNHLNTTFNETNTKFGILSSSSSYDPKAARVAIDQFVADAQSAAVAVDQDDSSLDAAAGSLNDMAWLTVFSRGSLDKESARISHARKALADARIVAADHTLDGKFWQGFIDASSDLDTLGNQNSTMDWAGARTTLGQMKTHVDDALRLSSAPGLPPALHAEMTDFETLVADLGKLVDASQANDDAAIAAATAAVQSDAAKLGAYDFNSIQSDIDAFYKPYVDDFNAQMAAATA